MSRRGQTPWNKGKKMPHTPEWEERRLAAVRKAAKDKPRPRGYTRPREHTQPMLDAVLAKRLADPAANRDRAIRNLSRDGSLSLSKENSPNWKGGVTEKSKQWRSENGRNLEIWRKAVVGRHRGACADCGSTNRVQAHHIVPVSVNPSFAFLHMNGVPLCYRCHRGTDSFGGKAARKRTNRLGTSFAHIESMPHSWQQYDTVGNWAFGTTGDVLVLVSDMRDERYEFLVGLHEVIEALLCRRRGIDEDAITRFDVAFEMARQPGNVDEPGDDKDAPYKREHFFATSIERLMAAELDVDWNTYADAVDAL